eukprot:Skav206033  [mRNA]  locus=scaffold1314:426175:427011:+ [translate_table: standard]
MNETAKDSNYGKVEVFMTNLKGVTKIYRYYYDRGDQFQVIYDALSCHGVMVSDDGDMVLRNKYQPASKVVSYESISSWTSPPMTNVPLIAIAGGMKGGGLVRKHMTKDVALKTLKARVISNTCKTDDFEATETSVPADLEGYMGKFATTMENLQMLKTNGTMMIKAGIRQANTANLKTVYDAMTVGKRRGTTEEKIAKLAYVMFGALNELDCAVDALKKQQQTILKFVLEAFVDEYSIYQDGEAKLNMDCFKKDLEVELSKREDVPSANAEQRACIIM